MKKLHTSHAVLGIAVAGVAFGVLGCGSTDVVAKFANVSFDSVLTASADRVAWSSEDNSWCLSSPGGEQILFSPDFSRNSTSSEMANMDSPDVEFVFDAAPFTAAGLDVSKLPAVPGVSYEIENGKFMLHFELGSDRFSSDSKSSLNATFSEIVRTQRSRIGYHEALDHYGIKLGNGNMLEWAKDIKKNDKDLVFALNPEPFIATGIDPAKIAGWTFAKVEMKDDSGKTVKLDKLLKFYNLQ